jgi:hypothetical protein
MDGEPTKEPEVGAESTDATADLSSPWPPELFDDCESISEPVDYDDDLLVGLWRHAWLPGGQNT